MRNELHSKWVTSQSLSNCFYHTEMPYQFTKVEEEPVENEERCTLEK